MKKLLIFTLLGTLAVGRLCAQDSTYFDMGKGLQLSLSDGDYLFTIGGNIKTSYAYLRDTSALVTSKHQFNVQRAQFIFQGNAKNERLTFYLQTDFVTAMSLMEAWVGYDAVPERVFVAVGQKLVNTNNAELNRHQNFFQFVNPSLVSTNFARLGREFGLFVDVRHALGQFVIKPSIAITSGDGLNSFGNGTTDRFDYGGAKFGGRLELLPFGDFSEGNDFMGSDLAREKTPKLAIGGSFTTNQGASEAVGEGHGQFVFYSQIQPDGSFRNAYPNYQKIYLDLVFKHRGFSAGAEFANAYGSEIKGLFTDTDPVNQTPIYRSQIARYLALGRGYNVQGGYLTKNFWSFDVRHTVIEPEFPTDVRSVMVNQQETTVGITKFLKGQALKVQTNFNYLTYDMRVGTVFEEKGDFSASVALQAMF